MTSTNLKQYYIEESKKLCESAVEMTVKSNGEYVEQAYLKINFAKLINMILDTDNFYEDSKVLDEAVLIDQVIKVNKIVSKETLTRFGVSHVIFSGLYTTVPMYLLPSNKIEKAQKNRWKAIFSPEKYGLPSCEEVDYATLKPYSSGVYCALAKIENSFSNYVIGTAKNYSNVFLPDIEIDSMTVKEGGDTN